MPPGALTHAYESCKSRYMSIRLQVIMEPKELAQIKRIAKAAKMTVAEWTRQWLRKGIQERSERNPEDKITRLRKLSKTHAPTCDIDQMLKEIESGYLSYGTERIPDR